ncbi:MAG: hypothetical protein KDD69_00615, partial [Bdellovibrionales bacterium]|nr:hypothetical protein [Bdellovibrionales bacterium]
MNDLIFISEPPPEKTTERAQQRVYFKNKLHAARPGLWGRTAGERMLKRLEVILKQLLKPLISTLCSARPRAIRTKASRGL